MDFSVSLSCGFRKIIGDRKCIIVIVIRAILLIICVSVRGVVLVTTSNINEGPLFAVAHADTSRIAPLQ